MQHVSRENQDSKSRWRTLKAATEGKRNETNITLNTNNGVLFNPEDVANHLNGYYVNKVEDIIKVSPPNPQESLTYTKEHPSLMHGQHSKYLIINGHEPGPNKLCTAFDDLTLHLPMPT